MAFKELDMAMIDDGRVFVSRKELMERSGVRKGTITNHINQGHLDGYRFRNRTYFLPEDVEQYCKMVKSGIIGN